jgi:hypothetical protein
MTNPVEGRGFCTYPALAELTLAVFDADGNKDRN